MDGEESAIQRAIEGLPIERTLQRTLWNQYDEGLFRPLTICDEIEKRLSIFVFVEKLDKGEDWQEAFAKMSVSLQEKWIDAIVGILPAEGEKTNMFLQHKTNREIFQWYCAHSAESTRKCLLARSSDLLPKYSTFVNALSTLEGLALLAKFFDLPLYSKFASTLATESRRKWLLYESPNLSPQYSKFENAPSLD